MPFWDLLACLYLAACLAVLGWLARGGLGGRAAGEEPAKWPSAAVLLPLAGSPAGLETQLQQLVDQDYGDFHLFVICQDAQSPMAHLARSFARNKAAYHGIANQGAEPGLRSQKQQSIGWNRGRRQ